MRSLLKGWLGEVATMDLFKPLPKTKAGNVFVLVLIDHFSRWAKPVALKKAGFFVIV